MNDIQQMTKNMLADINEVQLELATQGMETASDKIRGVKQQLLRLTGESTGNTVIDGYRHDAIKQCEKTRLILDRVVHGYCPSDNELAYVQLAAEQLAVRICTYLQRKILAEAPGLISLMEG